MAADDITGGGGGDLINAVRTIKSPLQFGLIVLE